MKEKKKFDYLSKIPQRIKKILPQKSIENLRPVQKKAIKKNIFSSKKSFIISSPTGSGKTLVAEFAMLEEILIRGKKVIYIVPLKALASEKYKEFIKKYSEQIKIRISTGELQSETYNKDFDVFIVTSEKLDSLIRASTKILNNVGLLIADEIHLLNDEKRGPTLEIILSLFKTKFPKIRIIGLSATISNAEEIAGWLNAELIKDNFRPIELEHHILYDNELIRYK